MEWALINKTLGLSFTTRCPNHWKVTLKSAVVLDVMVNRRTAFCTTTTMTENCLTSLSLAIMRPLVPVKRKIYMRCTQFYSTARSLTCAEEKCNFYTWVSSSIVPTVIAIVIIASENYLSKNETGLPKQSMC